MLNSPDRTLELCLVEDRRAPDTAGGPAAGAPGPCVLAPLSSRSFRCKALPGTFS